MRQPLKALFLIFIVFVFQGSSCISEFFNVRSVRKSLDYVRRDLWKMSFFLVQLRPSNPPSVSSPAMLDIQSNKSQPTWKNIILYAAVSCVLITKKCKLNNHWNEKRKRFLWKLSDASYHINFILLDPLTCSRARLEVQRTDAKDYHPARLPVIALTSDGHQNTLWYDVLLGYCF